MSPSNEEAGSDIFELPPEGMVAARKLARRLNCDLMTVLIAVLALLERADEKGISEHRFVIPDAGRTEAQGRSIGAFQVNGLVSFQLTDGDSVVEAVAKAKDAVLFLDENIGPGLESLQGELIKQRGSIPIPFRMSVHVGEPPSPDIVCPGLPFKVTALVDNSERVAPLDIHAEGSIMFLHGSGIDCAMVSWWGHFGKSQFYAGLRNSFGPALTKLFAEAPRDGAEPDWNHIHRFQVSLT